MRPIPFGEDDYRCFSIPSGLLEDRFVRRCRGQARESTHCSPRAAVSRPHESVAALEPPGQARPGYECFGDPGFTPTGVLGGWAPGNRPRGLPEGTAYTVSAGSRIVVQVHYHPDGTQQSDQTRVGFFFSSHPDPKPFLVLPLVNTGFEIPPGQNGTR